MSLDKLLDQYCTQEMIETVYWDYKRSRVDELLARGEPKVVDWLIANGATYEQVLGFDHPAADLPVFETKVVIDSDGRKRYRRLVSIPMGADGVTSSMFEDGNTFRQSCLQIANRLSKGNYLFHPFREVIKPKNRFPGRKHVSREEVLQAVAEGSDRTLSVASIRDAIVQIILYRIIEPEMEMLFRKLDHPIPVSYAYRKGKSAGKAARAVFKHLKAGYVHILDADLKKFFDTIPTQPLLDRLGEVIDPDSRVYKLIRRYIRVDCVPYLSYVDLGAKFFQTGKAVFYYGPPAFDEPQLIHRTCGVPQGGVLSGLLANLYMHSFDRWIREELTSEFDNRIRYVRYADDFVILARSEADVFKAYEAVFNKIQVSPEEGGLGLQMHALDKANPKSEQSKTRYVDASERPVKFVGFHINSHKIRIFSREDENKPGNLQKFKHRWQEAIEFEVKLRKDYPDPKERLRELIRRRLRFKIYGRTVTEQCKSCGRMKMKRRSWMAFFSASTDKRQIRRLEKWMRKMIYQQFHESWPTMIRNDLREARLPSLYREYYRVQKMQKPCACKRKPQEAQDQPTLISEPVSENE